MPVMDEGAVEIPDDAFAKPLSVPLLALDELTFPLGIGDDDVHTVVTFPTDHVGLVASPLKEASNEALEALGREVA